MPDIVSQLQALLGNASGETVQDPRLRVLQGMIQRGQSYRGGGARQLFGGPPSQPDPDFEEIQHLLDQGSSGAGAPGRARLRPGEDR